MKISDLEYIKNVDKTDDSVVGGLTFNLSGPVGVLFVAANDQEATGVVAVNKAEVGINFDDFSFDDLNNGLS
ncbi:MAG: hypothetical protein AAF316_18155 [Cyanobacteria bacterium P01_A01_bin.80]